MINLRWINKYVIKHFEPMNFNASAYKQTRLAFKYPNGDEYQPQQLLRTDLGKAGGYVLALYNTLVLKESKDYHYNIICLNKQMTKAELEETLKSEGIKSKLCDTDVLFNYMIIRNFQSAQNYKDTLNDLTQVLPELGERLDVSPAFHFGGNEWIYFNKETNVVTFVTDSPNRKWCDIDRLIYLAMSYKGMLEDAWLKDVALNLVMTTSFVDQLDDDGEYSSKTEKYNTKEGNSYWWFAPKEPGTYVGLDTELEELMTYVSNKLLELNLEEEYNKERAKEYDKIFKDGREVQVAREIDNLQNRITNLEQDLRTKYSELYEKRATLLGYITNRGDVSPAMDLMNYVDTIQKTVPLKIIETGPGSFQFEIKSLCSNFDPDVASMVLSNDRWMETHPLLTELKECFLEDNARILFTTNFYLDDNSFSNARRNVEEDRLPNPHINNYNCFGDNTAYIHKALASSDYIQALQTILEATKNINFNDSTVMQAFERDLGYALNRNTKCIKLKDGRELTIEEYRKEKANGQDISQSESEEGTIETATAS